tara:strand:+ start:1093 stop:1743 length:651 start_codon:yes stop_codon:yes gene_type:complete
MANIGYPNTKNKKKSSLSLGTPFFEKKEDNVDKHPYVKVPNKYSIQGPKVSYDMAYKNRDKKTYPESMSKEDYIKEAKRQTKSVKATGKWDVKSPESYAGTTQPEDSTKITSENVTVKSNKEKRKEKQAEKKKGRATKRITKLQNKALKSSGPLPKSQQKRFARNLEKSKGKKVSDENRTTAGRLIGKVGSKIKAKIQERKEKKKKKKEDKDKDKK